LSLAKTASPRPVWFDAFLVGVLAFLVFAATAQYHDPLNNDTRAAAIAAWQLAHHGNATLDAFYGHYGWLFESHGRYVTDRFPGVIFLAVPFYAVFGGNRYPAIYPGAIAADLATAAATGLVFALATRLVSRPAAVVAALLFSFATGAWTVSADQLWTHGPAQAMVLLTVLLAARKQWLLASIPSGFAILIRPHLGEIAVVLGLAGVLHFKRARPLLIAIGSAVGVVILLLYNHALWDRWSVFGGYHNTASASTSSLREFLIGIPGVLVSPERGMLVMTPALLVLLPGLRRAWRVADWWIRASAIAGLAYLATQLWLSRFSGGDGFYSYRTTLESLALWTPLLVLCWHEWTAKSLRRQVAFATLAVVSVVLHAFGAVINWTPSGKNLSPWETYMPIDLAHHIGAAATAVWIAVGLAAVVSSIVWTLRHPADPDAAKPIDGAAKVVVA
jgi:alpha-1,2-mannosyltransferase